MNLNWSIDVEHCLDIRDIDHWYHMGLLEQFSAFAFFFFFFFFVVGDMYNISAIKLGRNRYNIA